MGREEEEEEASHSSAPLRLLCRLHGDVAPSFWKDALEGHSFVPEHLWLLRMSFLGSSFWAFQEQKRHLLKKGTYSAKQVPLGLRTRWGLCVVGGSAGGRTWGP